jgi:hypothetical protein
MFCTYKARMISFHYFAALIYMKKIKGSLTLAESSGHGPTFYISVSNLNTDSYEHI